MPTLVTRKMAKRKRRTDYDDQICPICGEYMEVRCTGHRNTPFVDGKCYNSMCFVCFHVPKMWVQNGENWEGPFFDHDHLNTAEELVEDGVETNVKRANLSVKALKKKIAIAKKAKKV